MENQALKWKFCLSYSHSSAAQSPILFSFSPSQPNHSHCFLFKGEVLTFQNSLYCCLWVLQTLSNVVSSNPCLWAGLEFLRKDYSSLTFRVLELALGYRDPCIINRRYVFIFQCLGVILGQCMHFCWIALPQLYASVLPDCHQISRWHTYSLCRVNRAKNWIFVGTVNMSLRSSLDVYSITRSSDKVKVSWLSNWRFYMIAWPL